MLIRFLKASVDDSWKNKISENYFSIFLIVTSVIYFFGNARIKSRMFYNIPIGLFASNGFINIIRNEKFNNFKNALFFYVFISLIVYLFRSLANLI